MSDLHAAVEGYLAGLSDEDWLAMTARVRPPAEATDRSDGTQKSEVSNEVALQSLAARSGLSFEEVVDMAERNQLRRAVDLAIGRKRAVVGTESAQS